jgi:hypothetical protein
MAYEMDLEFVKGSHAPLLNPLRPDQADHYANLASMIMAPLQQRLIESGFDGLVWQAGKGNPVGVSNFMMIEGEVDPSWAWIDMESGLPALFALNPLATLFYYLPKSFKHRNWLFDDVDCSRLSIYLDGLEDEFDQDTMRLIRESLERLELAQFRWKSQSRNRASLEYAFSQAKINERTRDFYLDKPVRWLLLTLARGIRSFVLSCGRGIRSVVSAIARFKYKKLFRRMVRYVSSSYYRWGVVRWFIKREIRAWLRRGFLNENEKVALEQDLHRDEISAYLTDFSIHLGVKPFVKGVLWTLVPVLVAADSISLASAAFFIVWTGPIIRTVYTLWRMLSSLLVGRPHFPLVALGVGALPVVGNLAYPLEILYRSAARDNQLGQFMACAFSAKLGRKIPIWGGQDSGVEHFFNRVGYRISQFGMAVQKPAQSTIEG